MVVVAFFVPRPLIDATCSGMDLGYEILEPSCDFLELLGAFYMAQKKHPPWGKREKWENRFPSRFLSLFAFLIFLKGGRGGIFHFLKIFGNDFATLI